MVVIIINVQLRPRCFAQKMLKLCIYKLLALLSLDYYNAVQCSTTSAILVVCSASSALL